MSLINCPECGKKMSDQAESCPHCGKPHTPTTECPECGATHDSSLSSCPNCGFVQTVTATSKSKNTTSPVMIAVVVVMIAGLILAFSLATKKQEEVDLSSSCQSNLELIEKSASSYINILNVTPEEVTIPALLSPPKPFEYYFSLDSSHVCPTGGTYTLQVVGGEVKASCSHH